MVEEENLDEELACGPVECFTSVWCFSEWVEGVQGRPVERLGTGTTRPRWKTSSGTTSVSCSAHCSRIGGGSSNHQSEPYGFADWSLAGVSHVAFVSNLRSHPLYRERLQS